MADVGIIHEGQIVRLRLARPAKKNALTDAMMRVVAQALNDADADPAVMAAIIEAEGPDFCAGNDLAMMAELASGRVSIDDLASDVFLGALSGFGKPLLAAVRGRAIGVGATLLLHCDVVVAAHDARISFPFVDLSVVPEAASTYLVPARIGHARAYALLCLTEAISGAEAARTGLITRSVDQEEVDIAVGGMAERLARKPAGALHATKLLMKDHDAIARALARDKAAFIAQLGAAGPGAATAFENAARPTISTGVQV